jgi:hypothetical protein
MSMTHNECLRVAEAIVADYKAKKLPRSTADYAQLLKWATDETTVLQVRSNKINVDTLAEIVDRIRYFQHMDFADDILVEIRSDGTMRLINGNHTNAGHIEAIEKKLVKGLTGANIAIIPEERLPSNSKDRERVLQQVALVMNRKEVVHNKTTKADVRDLIRKDIISGVDVNTFDYQSTLSATVQMKDAVIGKLIMEAKVDLKEAELRQKFNFKQYSAGEINLIKQEREAEFEDEDESVAVTWAVVTRDKIYETLGKAVGNALNYNKAHIIFHFKNYSDTKLKKDTVKSIDAWTKHCTMQITYEFLPYKDVA